MVCAGFFLLRRPWTPGRGDDDGVGVFFLEGDRSETYGAGAAVYEVILNRFIFFESSFLASDLPSFLSLCLSLYRSFFLSCLLSNLSFILLFLVIQFPSLCVGDEHPRTSTPMTKPVP